MASNYPTSLDNFTNPTSNDSLNSPSHSLQHANINDAVEAIEAKLGIGASPAGSATSGYVLTAGTGGTTTWAEPSQPGLTLIKTQTIGSAVASVEVTNAFSSTYDSYRIIVSGGALSAAESLTLSFSSITSGYYSNLNYGSFQNTNNARANANTTAFIWVGGGNANCLAMDLAVFNPNLAKSKWVIGYLMKFDNGDVGHMLGYNNSTTQSTGFTLNAGAGTMSGGTIRVYGFRNS